MSSGSVYRRLLSQAGSTTLESSRSAPGELPSSAVLMQQMKDQIAWLENRLGHGADADALERLMDGARRGLRELGSNGDGAHLGRTEIAGLEAVVYSDGSRPVLFVEDDFVDLTDPAAAVYATTLALREDGVRTICQGVGRVQDLATGDACIGTAWALGEGLVVTNYHVLEAISTKASRADGSFTGVLNPGASIDFGGEIGGGPPARRFPIRHVAGVGSAGAAERVHPEFWDLNFDGLDLALLELGPVDGQQFPDALTIARGDDPTTHGALASPQRGIFAVGFPADAGELEEDVFMSLFGGEVGVKRLTPGIVTAGRGELEGDDREWIIGHDASTLGGSSGSVVVDRGADECKVLGLHFAGISGRVNLAHGFEGTTSELDILLRGARG